MLSVEQLCIHSLFAKILTKTLVLIVTLLSDRNPKVNKTINNRVKIISILGKVVKMTR